MRAAIAATLFSLAAVPVAGEIFLALPIDCQIGDTCHIQHLVDRDTGPDVQDFTCGRLSYDGHKGTDFALRSLAAMETGVDILAAAPGVVIATRDGMPDVEYSAQNAKQTEGRDCGNGLVIQHHDGWETQYCHLKRGSIAVQKGARVEQGAVLGQVGLSGRTQFPHLHLSVRHDGAVVDPFDPTPMETCGSQAPSMWETPPAAPPGGLIDIGFAPGIPSYAAIKAGTAKTLELLPESSGLVLFAYAFGGQAGDEVLFNINGPNGQLLTQGVVLEKDQAQYFRASGKRLTADRWPSGTYRGTVRLRRGDADLAQQTARVTIP